MKFAVEWDYVAKSPCRIIDAFAGVAARRPGHTYSVFNAVMAHLDPDLQQVMAVPFAAHLRIGGACGLD